jgi:hypothetical protein
MFEAYKIGVKISLLNNVSSGLVALAAQFQGLNKHVAATNSGLSVMEAKLASIKRMGLVGGAMAVTGVGMLLSLKGPIEKAIEWEREAAKMRQMGLGEHQIKEAQKFVQANNIIGTSMQQRMKLFVEAQGAFRESGMSGSHALEAAKVMTPALAGYELAVKTLNGEKRATAEHSMISLNRLVEQMGGLNDSRRAASIVDMAFRSVQASGKMITPDQLRQFRAYGGSAVANYSDLAIFASLEPIMGELKGSTTGMGLRTAYNRMQGLIKPPNQLLSETERLGIWDSTKYTKNSMGGIKTMKGNPLREDLAGLMNTNPVEFAKKMLEIYAAHGITSQAAISRENALLFGSNGAKVYDLIMRQTPTLDRSVEAFKNSRGIDETNRDNAKSPMMAIEKFNSAVADLGLVVGQTVLPVLTPMISGLADMFGALKEYPGLVKGLTIGFIGLASVAAIGGTLLLVTAGFKALGLALAFSSIGGWAGILRFGRILGTGLAGGLRIAGQALLFLGRALLMNPIGLVITAIAAAAYLLWKNWDYVGPKLKAAWDGIKSAVGALSDWLRQKWDWIKSFLPSSWFSGGGSGQSGGSPYVATGGGGQTQITTEINMDGRKVAEAVSQHQAKAASRPFAGSASFDYGMAAPPVGMGYAR